MLAARLAGGFSPIELLATLKFPPRTIWSLSGGGKYTHNLHELVYTYFVGRTNIVINDDLVRKARKLTRLKTKREIVDRALELLVRLESRKGILRYYGRGLWKGDLKVMRRNRG